MGSSRARAGGLAAADEGDDLDAVALGQGLGVVGLFRHDVAVALDRHPRRVELHALEQAADRAPLGHLQRVAVDLHAHARKVPERVANVSWLGGYSISR